MTSLQLCQLIAFHSPCHSENLKVISRQVHLSTDETAEAVAYAFFRAFPINCFPQINVKLALDFRDPYLREFKISIAVLRSLTGKAHVKNHDFHKDVESDPEMQTFIGKFSYTYTGKVSDLIEERTMRALRSLAAPYHQGKLLKFSPKTLEFCKDLETEYEILTHKLYNKEPCTPLELLPVFNRVAIFVPTDSPDKWMSWGMAIEMYHQSVPGRVAKELLENYPLSEFLPQINLKSPLANQKLLPEQSFQEFVVHTTLRSIEQTLGFPLPKAMHEQISASLMHDETLRKDLSFYVVYLEQFVDEPIPEGPPDRNHLFHTFRILFNLMTTHIPPEYHNQRGMSEIAFWVFASNRENVICLDKPNFPRPKSAEDERFSFHPNEFADRINALKPLYDKNGEEFLPKALSLLTIFPKEPFIRFILRCNELPFAQITTRQVLDLSHNDGINFQKAERVLEEVVKRLPPGLEGRTSAFFDMMTDVTADEKEWPPQIELFTKLLSPPQYETLNSDLYFKVLHLFLKGKIIPKHFEMFTLFYHESEAMTANQRLDLIYRATQDFESPPLKADPLRLRRALFLLKPQKMQSIQTAMSLLKVEGPRLIQYLACQPLSPLPKEINKGHLDLVNRYLAELRRHPFTEEQHLHLFYEFLCLQEKPIVLYQNIQVIHLIETFIGHSLDTESVYIYLCYHPDISEKEVEKIFDTLMHARKKLMTDEIERPIVNPELMARIVENLAELHYGLMDQARMIEFATAHEHVNEMIGTLQFHLSSAIAFPLTAHLLRGFPDSIPAQNRAVGIEADRPMHFGPHSPCHALIPFSLELNIHKDMYSDWEEQGEEYLYRFSLVSTTDTFSGSALLPFKRELLIQNPMLLSVIKDLCSFLCLDTYWEIHNRNVLNYEKLKDQINNLEILLAFNSKAKRVWEAFNHPHKETFAPGIFAFVIALKTQHRQALLNIPTHGENHHQSPMRLDPKTFPKLASRGSVFFVEKTHSLLPAKLLPPSSALFPFYSSMLELKGNMVASIWEGIDYHLVIENLKTTPLAIVEKNWEGIELPLVINYTPRNVEYNYRVQVFEEAEIINLSEELEAFNFEGSEITLKTEYKGQVIQVVVTYPNTKISSQETLAHWMSWQIAMLKSRVYERITHQAAL